MAAWSKNNFFNVVGMAGSELVGSTALPWSREVDEHSSAQSQPLAHDSTRPESTGLRLTGWSTPSLNCKSMRSDAIGSSSSTTPITGTEGPYRVNVSGRVYSVMIDETREASSGALRRRTAGESSTCANHSSLSALIDAIKLPKSLGRPGMRGAESLEGGGGGRRRRRGRGGSGSVGMAGDSGERKCAYGWCDGGEDGNGGCVRTAGTTAVSVRMVLRSMTYRLRQGRQTAAAHRSPPGTLATPRSYHGWH